MTLPLPRVEDLPSVEILGTHVHGPTLDQAIRLIENWIDHRDGECHMVVETGFHGIWVAHQDPGFRSILNRADLFCPDGIAPIWLARLAGHPLPERVPGPDLFAAFLVRAQKRRYRSYFYGDTEEVLQALCRRIDRDFPGAEIAGAFPPPFSERTETERENDIARIHEACPDILWVALGCPKQERWIAENRGKLHVPVVVGVGVVFRFFAGTVVRAPAWLRDRGAEWLWRLGAEPRKLWKRDLIDGPRFLVAGIKDALKTRWSHARSPERFKT